MDRLIPRPNIELQIDRRRLKPRVRPYWVFLDAYNRMLGYHKLKHGTFWVARLRTTYGSYRQHRLGQADDAIRANGLSVLNYGQARTEAEAWFANSAQTAIAAEPRRRHVNDALTICPVGREFTIGHALHDYVEWKRIAAARSNFPILVSIINFHIVPRLASLPFADFTIDVARQFTHQVLVTPGRRGNRRQPDTPLNLERLTAEELRKRKKTANSCLTILRVALRMAWENGRVESERPSRVIRLFKKVNAARAFHLSRRECERLLAECRPDVGRIVLGALYTGCRIGELLEMRSKPILPRGNFQAADRSRYPRRG